MQGPLLVFGASGLVGGALASEAERRRIPTVGVARTPDSRVQERCDLADAAAVRAVLERVRPSTVVISAALTNLDLCEAEPDRSLRENVETVRNVVDAAEGSRVIFLSTDHAFDGTKASYVESDPVSPVGVYARHKCQAEALVVAAGGTVARTAWVFGPERRRKNFVYQVVDTARRGAALRVPAAEGGCPTSASWLAWALFEMGPLPGIVHLTGAELYTKERWAKEIARVFGLDLTVEEVAPAALKRIAPRPTVCLRSERHQLIQKPAAELLASACEQILAQYEEVRT